MSKTDEVNNFRPSSGFCVRCWAVALQSNFLAPRKLLPRYGNIQQNKSFNFSKEVTLQIFFQLELIWVTWAVTYPEQAGRNHYKVMNRTCCNVFTAFSQLSSIFRSLNKHRWLRSLDKQTVPFWGERGREGCKGGGERVKRSCFSVLPGKSLQVFTEKSMAYKKGNISSSPLMHLLF